MSDPRSIPPPGVAVVLGGWLAASFAWAPVVAPPLLVAAIAAGAFGLPAVAYGCLAILVAAVGWLFAGSGLWLGFLAVAVFNAEWRDKRPVSACFRSTLWMAAGAFLVFSGVGALWGFFSRWPLGYWPAGRDLPP